MIYIRIWGGIGNQMFQFAAAQALALKHNTQIALCLDRIEASKSSDGFTERDFELVNIFDLNDVKFVEPKEVDYYITNDLPFLQKLKRKTKNFGLLYEKNLSYHLEFENLPGTAVLDGYFQSEKYFKDYESNIKERFKFDQSRLNNKSTELIDNFPKNALAIHVRRGDYVDKPEINKVHGTCSVEYYQQGVDHLKNQGVEQILIFSDDPNWVKQNLTFDFRTTYVDWNKGKDSWQDMFLLSKCRFFVIANSSFSWWGAWLAVNNDKVVVAPKRWFLDENKERQTKDLIPASWIKM